MLAGPIILKINSRIISAYLPQKNVALFQDLETVTRLHAIADRKSHAYRVWRWDDSYIGGGH
jgi:hypothetical protein